MIHYLPKNYWAMITLHYKYVILGILGVFVFCEYIVYHLVLLQCAWPQLDTHEPTQPPLKVMVLADTHLLGNRNGHWFDKLRREWQMYRSFQTVNTIHRPDVFFFLGDLMDEGQWASPEEFQQYTDRFNSLFYVSSNQKVFAVAGNHDIGFHYRITLPRNTEFENNFNASSVRLLEIEGSSFVLLNSMAFEGDQCILCRNAEKKLRQIAQQLDCVKDPQCTGTSKLSAYSQPIVLQHFPLFRKSDSVCNGEDSAPLEEKDSVFRERWECLSQESTNKILTLLKPRLVLSGHTHYGCHLVHPPRVDEWTVPSFSWRNINNPAFLLISITGSDYAISKCFLPRESTVYAIYALGACLLLVYLVLSRRRLYSVSMTKFH